MVLHSTIKQRSLNRGPTPRSSQEAVEALKVAGYGSDVAAWKGRVKGSFRWGLCIGVP